MTSAIKTPALIALLVVTLVPAASVAQQQGQRPPPPDFAAMAADLGVTEAAVETCLPRPEQGEQQRPDMSGVATCLKEAGSALSADQITAVLQDHAPARPPRQG